jgi:adenylate cyclase
MYSLLTIIISTAALAAAFPFAMILSAARRRRRRRHSRSLDRSLPKFWDVTIVVTNLTGMVGLFERLGDGASAALLNRYFAAIVPIIHRHNGYVARMNFDQLICWFGAFGAEGNHAEAALRCVLAMQDAVDELNQSLKLEHTPELTMRAGVASGGTVIGNIGSPQRMEFTALGEVPSLALRLEKAAKDSSSRNLISGESFRRTRDLFRVAPRTTDASESTTDADAYEVLATIAP